MDVFWGSVGEKCCREVAEKRVVGKCWREVLWGSVVETCWRRAS